MKDCNICRHTRRQQVRPHAWNHSCALGQRDFPRAADCAAYEPTNSRISAEAANLGYVWDGEYEGAP